MLIPCLKKEKKDILTSMNFNEFYNYMTIMEAEWLEYKK